ncbi:MAG: glutathione S-transferase family protein [Pseudomonadota bacterium]
MGIDKLILHHYPASRSARVRWMLHEVRWDNFELRRLDILQGEQYQSAYRAKNPNHAVPLLEILFDDGSTLNMVESAAIVGWLADAMPETGLAPPPGLTRERAEYEMMTQLTAGWMDMMLWQIRVHRDILPEEDRDPKTIERYRGKITTELEPQLITRLKSHDYIAGEAFSAADIIAAHCIMWARGYQLCRDDLFRAYLSRVTKRPAFIAAFDDAHEFSQEVPDGRLRQSFTG